MNGYTHDFALPQTVKFFGCLKSICGILVFIIHILCTQIDAMAMSVLTDTQREAVDYVLQRSEADSRKVFPKLLKRVKGLGYDEKDLEKYDTNNLGL